MCVHAGARGLCGAVFYPSGYVTFLDSNTQRTEFRANMDAAGGNTDKVHVGYLFGLLGKRPATCVTAKWMAADGKPRTSYLLTSGYW